MAVTYKESPYQNRALQDLCVTYHLDEIQHTHKTISSRKRMEWFLLGATFHPITIGGIPGQLMIKGDKGWIYPLE